MPVSASSPDEEAVSRWDGEGGSQPAAPALPPGRDPQQFLRLIGLANHAEVRDGEVSFPPGILWPYTSDLRRVRDEYDAARNVSTVGLLAAIATLYERIAFAPGGAGGEVADAYNDVKDAPDALGSHGGATRLCSRCRRRFPAPVPQHPDRPEEWWLCAPCHDGLIGKGARRAVQGQRRPRLFDPLMDGAEIAGGELDRVARYADLHPRDWFKPFGVK